MSFKIEGILIEKFDTVQISDKFSKRDFIVEVPGKYPDLVKFELKNDDCDRIENIAIGQTVMVDFNIKGRKWERDGKVSYFNNLDAWNVTDIVNVKPYPVNNAYVAKPVTDYSQHIDDPITQPPAEAKEGNFDDLPFLFSIPIATRGDKTRCL